MALKRSIDTPTNNFATLNPLDFAKGANLSNIREGNLRAGHSDNDFRFALSNSILLTVFSCKISAV